MILAAASVSSLAATLGPVRGLRHRPPERDCAGSRGLVFEDVETRSRVVAALILPHWPRRRRFDHHFANCTSDGTPIRM